jgi:hypothetical protein
LAKLLKRGDYMSIITKPNIEKGQENVITFAKSELATQAKIVSDSYFSNQSNWKQVVLTYESAVGNQMKRVVFDASEATPEGVLELSDKAKNQFEVKSLTIFDFDGGYLKLERADLTVAEFDIVIGSVVSGNFVTWDIANAQGTDTYELLGDGSVKKTGVNGYVGVIPTVEFIPANSDGYIEMTYVDIAESESVVWGLSSAINSSYGSINFNLYKALPSHIEGTLGNSSIIVNNGDVFRIAREGSLIKAYKNYVDESSVPFRTISDSTNGALLYGAASLFYTDSAIRLVKIG